LPGVGHATAERRSRITSRPVEYNRVLHCLHFAGSGGESQRSRLQWRHPLRPGEVLLVDNWRVLHGRAAYQGERRLCGAYLNREDFESRLHILRQSAV
jgi:alpha-ketoglutarate-dependent taurine dioxygenase